MFLRSAAIGVRSSCDASATRWRCASIERSSASSVWLKLAASRRSSIGAGLLKPRGCSSSLVTASVRAVNRSIGAQRRPGDRAAQQRRQQTSRRRSAGRRSAAGRRRTESTVGERERHLDRVVIGRVPDGEDLEVRVAARWRRRRSCRCASSRDVQHLRVTGSCGVPPPSRRTRAVRAHRLEVARGAAELGWRGIELRAVGSQHRPPAAGRSPSVADRLPVVRSQRRTRPRWRSCGRPRRSAASGCAT